MPLAVNEENVRLLPVPPAEEELTPLVTSPKE
jgi:hypothetical protein